GVLVNSENRRKTRRKGEGLMLKGVLQPSPGLPDFVGQPWVGVTRRVPTLKGLCRTSRRTKAQEVQNLTSMEGALGIDVLQNPFRVRAATCHNPRVDRPRSINPGLCCTTPCGVRSHISREA